MAPRARRAAPLSAFSPDGALFALASADGRIQVWDVATGRQALQLNAAAGSLGAGPLTAAGGRGHLAAQVQCLAWGRSSALKGKKKSSTLVAGTANGHVEAWNIAAGESIWRAVDCHAGGVTALAFAPDGGELYSAGANGIVKQLNVATGEVLGSFRAGKRAISSMAASPDGTRLLTAGATLKLFDVSTRQRVALFAGHATKVQAAVFTADGAHALSAAEGERHVAVWGCDGVSNEGSAAAVGVLAMEEPAHLLTCTEGQAGLQVLAVSEGGDAYVWNGKSVAQLLEGLPVRVKVAPSDSSNHSQATSGRESGWAPIFAGRFEGSSGAGSLTVVRGNMARPHFEQVTVEGNGATVALPPLPGGSLLPTEAAGGQFEQRNEPRVVSAEVVEQAVLDPQVTGLRQSEKKRKSDFHKVQQEGAEVAGLESDNLAGQGVGEEVTLEEQLRALGLQSDAQAEGGQGGAPSRAFRADSVQTLLQQALQAGDSALLDKCLEIQKPQVITNTVRRLHPQEAARLLAAIVGKLQSRPSRAPYLVPWMRAVLLQHAAYLMAAPGAQATLASLFQIVEAHMAVLQPLLALSGRLDLLVGQVKANQAGGDVADDLGPAPLAPVVFEDNESEEHVEDAMEASSESDDDSDTKSLLDGETEEEFGGTDEDEDEDGLELE